MAFIKAVSSIFLAATAVFIKTVGPFQQKEEPKLKVVTAKDFQVNGYTVAGGKATLVVKFTKSEDGKETQSQECWIFAQPENRKKDEELLNASNFGGGSVLEEVKKKLEEANSKQQSSDWIVKTCSKGEDSFLGMYFDLKEKDGKWVFDDGEVKQLFEGTYISKDSAY